MQQKITKAVFPVAGLGTRFLPATKANPKEMLSIVDKPLIQYAVEEAIDAGIETLIFITGRNKHCIQDHFDKTYELEAELEKKGKFELVNQLKNILPSHVSCVFIRQNQALGLGHAVNCAKPIIGDEPFVVLLADDLVRKNGEKGCTRQLIELFDEQNASILAVESVAKEETDKYGIVSIQPQNERVGNLVSIIEKPNPEEAPSNLAVIGRYILTPAIFKHLDSLGKGRGGEIQLTDAIAKLLQEESILSYKFEGRRYDCGSKLGYLIANVEHALLHPEIKTEFLAYLKNIDL
ncbi:MAG: UTP--glucose-1-phosphate uridylyltransferase GalU [Methylococcales bacterium]|nr:UTP--glucose-1-phosphate uridylyltransferase GalU [Methylococcales bacterium]